MAWFLGALVLLQTLRSLAAARRWRTFVHSSVNPQPAHPAFPTPPLTLVVPCRGAEPGLAENLSAYARQNYPGYELIFVTGSAGDPASAAATAVIANTTKAATATSGARLLHAPPRADEGAKVTKLLAAIAAASPESEVFVFADSDGRPDPGWLSALAAPLAAPESEAGAATGYRWYLPPTASAASATRAVWNSFIASLLGGHGRNFCWGGAMAVRRSTFERLNVARYWRGAVSDDYQLTRALNDAGLPIRFVPRCLVPNDSLCGWRELFSWTTRQIIITRVYAPRLWALGLMANGLYAAGIITLVIALPSTGAVLALAGIAGASMATGWLRVSGARHVFQMANAGARSPARAPFVLLAPLIPFLLLFNFIAAGLTRAIAWRGTAYRLEGPQHVVAHHR